MGTKEIQEIRGDLLKIGHTYASIAKELGVTRQHVRDVVVGKAASARVRAALLAKLGRDPWADNGKEAVA